MIPMMMPSVQYIDIALLALVVGRSAKMLTTSELSQARMFSNVLLTFFRGAKCEFPL
jgi:hypothetical protein